jgi:hypothetical protein
MVLLQEEGITFLQVQEILIPCSRRIGHLATDAEIVENVEFERAVGKIVKGLILTEEQRGKSARVVAACGECCHRYGDESHIHHSF